MFYTFYWATEEILFKYYNELNNYTLFNGVNAAPLYLGNVSKDFSVNYMKKLDYADYDSIDVDDILGT